MRTFARLLLASLVLAACGSKDAPSLDASVASASPIADSAPPVVTKVTTDAAVDVVTNASGTWSDAGAIVTGGKVDGAALRAKHKARLSADTSAVTVVKDASPRELGERVCEASVPKRDKATPILIKPNLGGFEWFRDPKKSGGDDGLRGRITDPEFVRGIVRCLKARGHTKITIAEGWGATHADWEHLIKASGYLAMTEEEHVPLVAMDDDGVFDVEGDTPGKPLALTGMEASTVPTLLVPKILAEHLEHGLFISAPKVKAHRFGVFSASLKGMQGTVMLSDAAPAFRQKSRTHRELNALLKGKIDASKRGEYVKALELFAERMTDVLEVFAPDVVLADGAPSVGGDGFGKQWPASDRFAIGGTNPVMVDRVAAELLGLWNNAALGKELGGHTTSPLLTTAAKRFGLSLDAVTVSGDGKDLLGKPRTVHYVSMAGFELHGDESSPHVVGTDAPAPGGGADAKPEAHAKPMGRDRPSLLADPAADAWKATPAVRFVTDYAGETTKTATSVSFLYEKEKALFVFFRIENHADDNTDLSRPIDKERAALYQEDCVELFLAPNPAKRTAYAEVEIGPHGHFLDLWVDKEKKTSDVAWSSGLTVGVRRATGEDTTFVEAKITAAELVRALVPGAKLPLGLYRMDGKAPNRRYLAFSPPKTKSPNFHVPEAFGTLVLDP